MKAIIICLMVCFLGLPASESGATYYPEPEMTDARTTAPTIGQLYGVDCFLYGAGLPICLTEAENEAGDLIPDNCWTDFPGGPCKKCYGDGVRLEMCNGVEVCMEEDPCPQGYEYGNYGDRDGCIKCPDNYQFNGSLCLWAGPGTPPPPPAPTVPTNFRVSRGTSELHIILSWNESNLDTDYYILQRLYSGGGIDEEPRNDPATSSQWRDRYRMESQGGPGSTLTYYDAGAIPVGNLFWYRVKACERDTGQCSEYTPHEAGWIAKEGSIANGEVLPGPIHILLGE